MANETSALGRLVAVDVRSIWAHEALDFTPWLARPENIALLAETLHLGELEVEATEKEVGRFSADIVARDGGGAYVLIENQLEPTDHRHLGQVLTYLAGLEGEATVVWIATKFLEEHRAAIDWLNANTNDRFDFFGVEIEVLRIGDSQPAPRFNIVAKPNDWSRSVRTATDGLHGGALNDTQSLYQSYWLAVRDAFTAAGETERLPKAWPRHWLPFRIGRSGFLLSLAISREQHRIRVEIYLQQRGDPTKQAFKQLEAMRDAIEQDLGTRLSWEELPNRQASRIALYLDNADPQDRADWPRQHKWLLEQMRAFRRAFKHRIQSLDLQLPESAVDELEPSDVA